MHTEPDVAILLTLSLQRFTSREATVERQKPGSRARSATRAPSRLKHRAPDSGQVCAVLFSTPSARPYTLPVSATQTVASPRKVVMKSGQRMHTSAPCNGAYRPFSHREHRRSPLAEIVPALHATHVGGEEMGLSTLPALQSAQNEEPGDEVPVVHWPHAVWPLCFAKSPIEQSRQAAATVAPCLSLCFPGGHALHFMAASTPAALENLPLGHGIHVVLLAAPATALHVPGLHGTHFVPPPCAYVPGKHVVQFLSPLAEIVPTLQAEQVGGVE